MRNYGGLVFRRTNRVGMQNQCGRRRWGLYRFSCGCAGVGRAGGILRQIICQRCRRVPRHPRTDLCVGNLTLTRCASTHKRCSIGRSRYERKEWEAPRCLAYSARQSCIDLLRPRRVVLQPSRPRQPLAVHQSSLQNNLQQRSCKGFRIARDGRNHPCRLRPALPERRDFPLAICLRQKQQLPGIGFSKKKDPLASCLLVRVTKGGVCLCESLPLGTPDQFGSGEGESISRCSHTSIKVIYGRNLLRWPCNVNRTFGGRWRRR